MYSERVKHAARLDRRELPPETPAVGVQAHERHHVIHDLGRAPAQPFEIGQRAPFIRRLRRRNQTDRQIAKARVPRQGGCKRLQRVRRESVSDHDAVDISRAEKAGRVLDAQRTDKARALAGCGGKLSIIAAASDDEHGCGAGRSVRMG